MRGEPRTMQTQPFARDAMRDVTQSLKKAAALATRNRVPKSQLVLDPGIGFGKSFAQNYELIARLPELARLGFPHSRRPIAQRLHRPHARRRPRKRANIRHRRRRHSLHPARRPHRPRSRRARDGPGSARRRYASIAKIAAPGRNREHARKFQKPHSSPAQHLHRLLPRLVARRLRFLHPDFLRQRHRRRISNQSFRHRRSNFPHPRHASRRRVPLRPDGRPVRTPPHADARHHRLLSL